MERKITISWNDLPIPCKIYEPEFSEVDQVIIGVHGFGGDKESSVLKAVAEEMFFYRTALIAFDFPAHGESPVTSRDLTLDNCQGVLLAVAARVKELFPGVSKFGIFATSFGAYTTLLAIDGLKEELGRFKLVLRCPAVRMNKTFLKIARTDDAGLKKKGRIICGYERKMELGYSFFEQLQANNAVADHDMPMMILQGDQDELVDVEDVEFFRLLNSKASLVMIPGATHRFNHEGDLDMIVDLARDWFLCEEVLLCEYT